MPELFKSLLPPSTRPHPLSQSAMSTHTSLTMESTANFAEQAHHSRPSLLEDLPSEIKIMILCHMPDVSSLSSIVHAFPAYHQSYLGTRDEVLNAMTVCTLQKNDLGLLDPWTTIHAPQLGYHIPHRVETISEYLDRYAQGRVDGSRRRLAPEDSLAILSLQRKFTMLIAKYCEAVFSENPFTESFDDGPLLPSQSESHRILRALWRYEIYSKLFGPSKESPLNELGVLGNEPLDFTFSEVEIARTFFGLFPIHEVEVLACLQKYAKDYYDPLLREPDQLVALGPKQLYQVMTAKSYDERHTRIPEGEKAGRVNVTMRAALDTHERDVSWGSWQWKGMYDEFISERVPTTGWLWASSRGIQYTDFRLRRWGCVFWDQERLDGWGITEENMVDWPHSRKSFGCSYAQT